MMRAIILVMTAAVGFGGLLTARADDPPKRELTPAERKELEAKASERGEAGVKAYRARKFAEAEQAITDALEIQNRVYQQRDHPELATTLNNLAVVLAARGRYPAAETRYREALEMRKRLLKGDHPDVAESLSNLGALLHARSRYADAEPFMRDALEMRRRLFKGDHPNVASSLSNLAAVLNVRGKHTEAEALHREALEMRRRLFKGDHPDVAMSLNNLASVLQNRVKYAEAELLFRDSLGMYQRLFKGDHPDLALSMTNLAAVLLDHFGRYAEAETLYRDALGIYQRLHRGQDHPAVARCLNNLAIVLRARGRSAEAEALHRDALEMGRRLYTGDHPELARVLHDRAVVLWGLGRHAEAEALHRDALGMRRRLYTGDHQELARSLNNLATVSRDLNRYAEAETFLREALEMRRRLSKEDHPAVAGSLNNLANILGNLGRSAEAEALHRDALGMRRRLYTGDHPDVAGSLNNLANILHRRGRYPDAEPVLRDAMLMYARLAAVYAAAGSEGDALTLAAAQPLTRDAFLANARLNGSDPASVYAEVWALKANVAQVAESRASAARAAGDPRAAALLAERRDVRRLRAVILLAPMPADPKTREARDADLAVYARKIQGLDKALRPLLPAVDRLDKLNGATPDDLRDALPADAAFVDLLAYTRFEQDPNVPGIKGEKRTPSYTAFVVTKDGVKWIDLGPAEPIEKAVGLWREAITTPPYAVAADLGAAVRDRVWNPVRKALPAGVKVVYVSPDAALTRVPWAAIPGDDPRKILLDHYAVAVVPHGRFLLDGLWPADPTRNRTARLLTVGGVPYGTQPESSGMWGSVLALARSRTRGELPTDPTKKLTWDDLPGAKVEAEQVRARAAGRGYDARLVAGPAASADRVLAELSRARFAHIATHGFFADKQFRSVMQVDPKLFETAREGRERVGAGALNPLVMSGLVFAGANRPGTPGRGILTGEVLLDRDLSGLELAVLSACETGLGDVAGGEGVFGLQRAFHVAGCRNVVASLWKVNDDATAALMAEFYRRLWDEKTPVPPVEALRQAQLAVMRADPKDFRAMALRGVGKGDVKDPNTPVAAGPGPMAGGRTNPPAYWAAFILSGPGR